MSSFIDPELAIAALLNSLTTNPVSAVSMAPSTSVMPQHVIEILDVETPTDAPHGFWWITEFQVTTIAKTAGTAFNLAGALQDNLLAAAENTTAVITEHRFSGATVQAHPLRTVTDKAASTVVATYSVTVTINN